MSHKYYAGWLYANLDEREFLKELGVFGPMIYDNSAWNGANDVIKNNKSGTISHCYCTEETLNKLHNHYQEWWEENYIYYDEVKSKYPNNHFSKVSKEWVKARDL